MTDENQEMSEQAGQAGIVSTTSSLSVGAAISKDISIDGEKVTDNSMVKFKASYQKDYKGPRHLQEGVIYEMAPESAKQLEEKGFGKIYKSKG